MTAAPAIDDFFAQNGGVDTITGQPGDVADVDPQDVVTGFPAVTSSSVS